MTDRVTSGGVPRVAIIGCGYRGRVLAQHFYQLGALAMLCDPNPEARAAAAALAPGVPLASAVEEVTAGAVVIATNDESHYDLARHALETGRDVFVEPPLALTYAQGARLVRLAQERHCILMVGDALEYHPGLVALGRLLQAGDLGQLHYIYASRFDLYAFRREENVLWSFAPSDVAAILRLVGALPMQVVAGGGSYIPPPSADVTFTSMLFESGVRANLHLSWLHPFREHRLVVVGSQRLASFDAFGGELLLYDQQVELTDGAPAPTRGAGLAVPLTPAEPRRLQCEAFLRAVATREPPVTDGDSALRVLRVLQAAHRSLVLNGEPVALPIGEPVGG